MTREEGEEQVDGRGAAVHEEGAGCCLSGKLHLLSFGQVMHIRPLPLKSAIV